MMHPSTATTSDKQLIIVATINKVIEEAIEKQLNSPNYDVHIIRRGTDVLLEILDQNVDLLVLDMELAGIMGMEILPIIRKMRPRLPVILITEDYTHQVRKMVAEQGVTFQAFKPSTLAEATTICLATEDIIKKRASAEVC